jgi:integron integrase
MKLLERLRMAIRLRHFSRRTEEAYAGWTRRYIAFHGMKHPESMGEAEIRDFLSSLAVRGKVSASTQNQALAALLFLYREVLNRPIERIEMTLRAKRPERLPLVLTHEETRRIIGAMSGVPRLVAGLLYGSGLRLMEALELRVKDLDFTRREILVRDGKGRKDRVTMLPATFTEPLRSHLAEVRALHERDLAQGAGRAPLPDALGRKYPNADREWGWQWVFPAASRYLDREAGTRRRHHLHESVIQKAMKDAVRRTGIAKPATPHTLRHYSEFRTITE